MNIRNYQSEDYEAMKKLYMQSDLYGGQFDEARDSKKKLDLVTKSDPQSILVYEDEGQIIGTVSLIENGRVAWLFRFAVIKSEKESEITQNLYQAACKILASRGHTQILVYSPISSTSLEQRYLNVGMNKGEAYTCFWQNIP